MNDFDKGWNFVSEQSDIFDKYETLQPNEKAYEYVFEQIMLNKGQAVTFCFSNNQESVFYITIGITNVIGTLGGMLHPLVKQGLSVSIRFYGSFVFDFQDNDLFPVYIKEKLYPPEEILEDLSEMVTYLRKKFI